MSLLPFPQSLADKYQPKRVRDFIGIPKPRKVMTAFARRPYPSSWFFLGSSGLGKTTMALAIAREINAQLHHIPSQSCNLDTIELVCNACLRGAFNFWGENKGKAAKCHLVLVDEADRMTPAAQLALLSKLDATAFPPETIFIFTANSAMNLQDRFLSRCRMLIFESDSFKKALPSFLAKVYKSESRRSLPPAICKKIATDSNFNVRDALMELEVELLSRAA